MVALRDQSKIHFETNHPVVPKPIKLLNHNGVYPALSEIADSTHARRTKWEQN